MGTVGNIDIQENIPLGPKTTIKLGGNATNFIVADTLEVLVEALAQAKRKGQKVHVLGGGSNTIFSDQGFNGLVIQIALKGIEILNDGKVIASAGEEWDKLVQQVISKNLVGFESMSGIPGLVGATPIQNVGAYGQDVSKTITHVDVLDRETMMTITFSNQDCLFEYRGSRFKYQDANRFVITKVHYQLSLDGQPVITYPQLQEKLDGKEMTLQSIREAVLELRASKSMVVDPDDPNSQSCGSFFVNPVLTEEQLMRVRQVAEPPTFKDEQGMKVPAAWLIEQAGFAKGYRKGGVGISENHPLALVNYAGTTQELLELAQEVQGKVSDVFDIALEREPVLIKP